MVLIWKVLPQDGAGLAGKGQEGSLQGGLSRADGGKPGKSNIRDQGQIPGSRVTYYGVMV